MEAVPNITAVHIRGYQSHVSTSVNLVSGLNVITGPSDAGKTALIRAVRWVAFGTPTGEAFVHPEVGEAEVVLELDTGVTVSKKRRKGKTEYRVSTIPEPFEKAEVPEEVKKALGIEKQTFGSFETALNFAFQQEAPFLISESASAGAKILGVFAGTEVVDLAIQAVSKDTYAAREAKSKAEKDLQNIEGRLLQFTELPSLRETLEACGILIGKLENDENRVKYLKDLTHSHGHIAAKIEAFDRILDRLVGIPDVEMRLQNVEKAQQVWEHLQGLAEQWRVASAADHRWKRELQHYDHLWTLESPLANAEQAYVRLASLNSLSTEYTGYAQAVQRADRILAATADTDKIGTMLEQIESRVQQKAKLTSLYQSYQAQATIHNVYTTSLERYSGLENAETVLAGMQASVERLALLTSLQTQYREAVERDNVSIITVANAGMEYERCEKELAAVWQEAGGTCPLCEQPLQGGHEHA